MLKHMPLPSKSATDDLSDMVSPKAPTREGSVSLQYLLLARSNYAV